MWGKTIINSWRPNFHLGDDPLFPHIHSCRWKRRRIEGTNNGQALVFPWFNIFSSQKLLQQHHGAKMKSAKTTHVAEIWKGRPNTPPPPPPPQQQAYPPPPPVQGYPSPSQGYIQQPFGYPPQQGKDWKQLLSSI